MATPAVRLVVEDALGMAELLEFVSEWLARPDVAVDVGRFVGGGVEVEELRADLARFVFLLGGTSRGVELGEEPW
jgi:hypothetical protein